MHQTSTDTSERLQIVEMPQAAAAYRFAEDVRDGLTASKKYLSSKYFYDDVGSSLFETITMLPEYYLTRAETEILQQCGWEMVRMLEEPIELLELGSGSAIKTRVLIEEALRVQGSLRYSPIDISRDALVSSATSLVDGYPRLNVRAFLGDYFAVLASRVLTFEQRVLALFLGSNIGNYSPEQARSFIALLGGALRPGDGLLLGVDRKKDATVLERAYNDPIGVTSAFDKNILARVNRELMADFDLDCFEHVARYDSNRGVVDSFLRATRDVKAHIERLKLDVTLRRDEMIHTESSYKFDDGDIADIAKNCGFSVKKSWSDAQQRFSVYLLVRTNAT